MNPLESLAPCVPLTLPVRSWPCFARCEFRSCSACLAMLRGLVFLYSEDMVLDFVMRFVVCGVLGKV
jgi:hypothetical protein